MNMACESANISPDDVSILKVRIKELENKVADIEAIRESLAISEARYRAIVENLRDVVFTYNTEGCLNYVTSNIECYGYRSSEIVGRNIIEFVHPDDRENVFHVHKRRIAFGDEIPITIKMLTADGKTCFMEDNARVVRNEAGKITHVVGILHDITERKIAEDAVANMNVQLEQRVQERTGELSQAYEDLKSEINERVRAEEAKQRSEYILAEVINFLPDPTFVIDRQNRVIVWNRAMEELTGVDMQHILGRGDYEYSLPFYGVRQPILIDLAVDPSKREDNRYLDVVQRGDALVAESHVVSLKGKQVYLWGIAKPFYDSQGEIIGAIESIRDITHIKDIEFRLKNELGKFNVLYDLALHMSAEKSLEDNLAFIVEKSRTIVGADVAFIVYADETHKHLCMHSFFGIESDAFKHLHLPIVGKRGNSAGEDSAGKDVRNREIRRLVDETVIDEGIVSIMAVPVKAGELVLGYLHVANRRLTEFSQNDLDTIQLFGNLAAIEIVRAQKNRELRDSETKYRTVFENTGSAMLIIEKDTTISLVNNEFTRLTGYSKEEIEGKKKWTEFVVPENLEEMLGMHRKRRSRPESALKQYEFRLKDINGVVRDIYINIDMIPGTTKSVASLADITEHKKAQQSLQKAHAELETRVAERTSELMTANSYLKDLLQKQDVNIDLAKNILAMINPRPYRHTRLAGGVDLFVTSEYVPCYAEGGDHFFVKNFTKWYPGMQKSVVSLKDQSGHEVSCILRSIVTDLIHNALLVNKTDTAVEHVVTRLNEEICNLSFFGEDNFFTAINAEIHHQDMKMRFTSAGHPPFLLIRGREVISLPGVEGDGGNLPIGFCKEIAFDAGEIALETGDKLIFYTDGLADLPRSYGKPVLRTDDIVAIASSIVKTDPRLPVSIIMKMLFSAAKGSGPDTSAASRDGRDDITLLGLELEDSTDSIEDVVCPGDVDEFTGCLNGLLEKMRKEWLDRGFASPETRLRMVLEEALANAWRHGNKQNPLKKISVRRRYGNDAVLEVIDEGDGFDSERSYDPTDMQNILNSDGRGNFLIRLLTEEVEWLSGGRHLIAYFSRHADGFNTRKPASTFNIWRREKQS